MSNTINHEYLLPGQEINVKKKVDNKRKQQQHQN